MRYLIFALLVSSSAHATLLYEYVRGRHKYQIHESRKSLQVNSEGFTYTLPIDGCTRPSADEFLHELEIRREQLPKARPANTPELGLLRFRDQTFALTERGLTASAPEYFARTTNRFINLLISEQQRCPKSFTSR